MNLRNAHDVAWRVREALLPYCDKIEIAGSIRRERAVVSDVDIVLLPKSPEAAQEIISRCRHTCLPIAGGAHSQNISFTMSNGEKLDLFVAHAGLPDLIAPTPSNWGAVLLCRTGSQVHNTQLAAIARGKGLIFRPYVGIVRPGGASGDEILASETEADIYRAVGLDYRDPTNRESL
jgi:DNA polymerase (family 10)